MDLESKVDKILDTLVEIKVTQAEQAIIIKQNEEGLAEHMQQTRLIAGRQDAFEQTLREIAFPSRALKYVLGGLVVLAGGFVTLYGVLKIFIA